MGGGEQSSRSSAGCGGAPTGTLQGTPRGCRGRAVQITGGAQISASTPYTHTHTGPVGPSLLFPLRTGAQVSSGWKQPCQFKLPFHSHQVSLVPQHGERAYPCWLTSTACLPHQSPHRSLLRLGPSPHWEVILRFPGPRHLQRLSSAEGSIFFLLVKLTRPRGCVRGGHGGCWGCGVAPVGLQLWSESALGHSPLNV